MQASLFNFIIGYLFLLSQLECSLHSIIILIVDIRTAAIDSGRNDDNLESVSIRTVAII